jgi:hypothetical protein
MQEYDGAAFYYRPDFDDAETPFRDVRDFLSQGRSEQIGSCES